MKINYLLWNLELQIQKAGRLNEESIDILKELRISIVTVEINLKASFLNFPYGSFLPWEMAIIPQYLRDGVGRRSHYWENVLIEKGEDIIVAEKLGFFRV